MDPYQQQSDQLNNKTQYQTNNSPPDNANRTAPDQQQPQHHNGLTMITPNQSRINNLRANAQKEEEEFLRYREALRSAPVHIDPTRLGGGVTLAEARERQFTNQRCSKLQKKLKKEEEEKRRKAQEEKEIQEMKQRQREKAERLEQKRQQEHSRRREQFQLDQMRVTDRFLQQLESKASFSASASSPIPNKDVPKVKKNLDDIQQEHKRTNAAFLDRLERQTKASNMSSSSSSSDSLHQESPSHPRTCPEVRYSGQVAGEDELNTASEPDLDWALMKLMSNFPHCDKDVLEDILSQCNGDYQHAYGLLSL